jgi:hypothetical protein
MFASPVLVTTLHGGLAFLTYTVFDEAVGEEVERLEVVPCRCCADKS